MRKFLIHPSEKMGVLGAQALLLMALACGGGQATIQPPTGLAYARTSIQAIVGQTVAPDTPTVTGSGVSFIIAPALPAGLRVDPQTGTLEGTPTMPAVEVTYLVTAANAAGAVTAPLQLFVAGFLPDLRFHWTGAFGSYEKEGSSWGAATPPAGGQGILMTLSGLTHWGPLQISSPTGDGWSCVGFGVPFPLVDGTLSRYTADHLNVLDQRLDGFIGEGLVITSLDLSVRGFAVTATGPKNGGSDYTTTRTTLASLGELSAWAAAQGQAGAVVTALATQGKPYDNAPATGPILALAATRQGDGRTFATQVVSGTPLELSQLLPPLGLQGYVVTAFGAGDQTAYVAVVTRPAGPAAPHVIEVHGDGLPAGSGYAEGFVPVGRMSVLGGSGPYEVFQR